MIDYFPRCAGDGSTLVSLEIVLATNARFLASEVKPFNPEPPVQKRNKKRKPETQNSKPEVPSKKPVFSIKGTGSILINTEKFF